MVLCEGAMARPTSGTAVQVKGRHVEHKRKPNRPMDTNTSYVVSFQLCQLVPLESFSKRVAKESASSSDAAGKKPRSCS